jgi:ABC-2 type transport system permease protein
MFKHTIKYEWITLVRDKWIIILMILFLSITFFAVRNGAEKVHDRITSIAKEREEVTKIDAQFKADIDSVNRKLKPLPKESWLDPRSLTNVAWECPRVVAIDPLPLALVSTGQSDLYTQYAKPKIYGEAFMLGFSELSNPVQLLFGSFDLSFVCIYLLPLLVLAFSYNILSSEKESGVLKLTFSQPVSVYRWLLYKLFLRFSILSTIVTLSILIALITFGVDVFQNIGTLLQVVFIILAYVLFWFMVALLVNLVGKSSGNNAITLIGVWLIFVLLIPSVISQLANSINPVPSRIHMIHQYRMANAEADKRADEILKSYYRDHPELAPKDTTQENRYAWILSYFASAEIVNQSVKPILDEYDAALTKQQAWVDNLRFLSPAILLQNSFNEISGTSTAHYADFRKQVLDFAVTWKAYFKPRMFANELMKAEDIAAMPTHTYSTENIRGHYGSDLFGIAMFTVLIAFGSLLGYRKYSGDVVSI